MQHAAAGISFVWKNGENCVQCVRVRRPHRLAARTSPSHGENRGSIPRGVTLFMEVQTIGIIGFGDFGQFLFTLAHEHYPDVDVKVFSSQKEPDNIDFFALGEVCKTDLVFVCVPTSAFESTIDKVLPLLGEHTILCDIATVKKYTVSILKEKEVPRYIATHPMFGPYSYAKHGNSLKDLRIAVCDSSLNKGDVEVFRDFLRQAGLKVLELTPDEHDRLIAETLFLTHLVGQTVKRGGFERTSLDTVSFGFLMDAVESVSHDEELFLDVYKHNPYCEGVLERFEQANEHVQEALRDNTKQ